MNQSVDKVAILHQARTPASQATHIEQSRAIAQVQGALIVAHQRPRDQIRAMQMIRDACQIGKLAERAFFKFPRGGQTVTGPSIHLATELARCWGNIDYGITELARDDYKGESEMQAVAWDLETNTRITNSFIVPHRRDKKGGVEALVDMRDIYENNANSGARRLRECIFRIIPVHVRQEAMDICRKTLEEGGGEALAVRIERLLVAFQKINITRVQIERKVGCAADRMTPMDLANLRISYDSIQRNEVSKDEEFPSDVAPDVTKALKASAAPPTEPAPAAIAPMNDPAERIDPAPAPDPAPSRVRVPVTIVEWKRGMTSGDFAKAFLQALALCKTADQLTDFIGANGDKLADLEGADETEYRGVKKKIAEANKKFQPGLGV